VFRSTLPAPCSKYAPDDPVNEYGYDRNGNMVYDTNKGINLITYNELNLPTKVQLTGSNNIDYQYNAEGSKYQKRAYNGSAQGTTTDYVGGLELLNDTLRLLHNDEGYFTIFNSLMPIDTTAAGSRGMQAAFGMYHYYLKDHLGNVCVTFDSNGSVKQEDSYYPFGLTIKALHAGGSDNKNLYNGKELQDEFGFAMYDYGARQQDPQTGRFWAIDPLAESYADISPYTFCAGDPINSADPTGCYVEGWVGEQTGVGVFGEHDSGNAGLGGGVGRIIPRYDASAWFCKLKDAVNRNEDISQYAKQLGAILIYSNTALGVYFNQKEALANNVMLDLGRCTINNDGSVGSPKDGGNGNAYHLYFGGATKFSPIVVSDQQTQLLIQSSDFSSYVTYSSWMIGAGVIANDYPESTRVMARRAFDNVTASKAAKNLVH